MASPTGLVAVPDHTKQLAVIDQPGKVWLIDKNDNKLATPFIDLTGKAISLSPNYDERGLIGLAFHPHYRSNGKCYLYYQTNPRTAGFNNGQHRDGEIYLTVSGIGGPSGYSGMVYRLIEAKKNNSGHH